MYTSPEDLTKSSQENAKQFLPERNQVLCLFVYCLCVHYTIEHFLCLGIYL